MDDPKHVVAAGYDAMASQFDEWQRHVLGSPRMRYLDELLALLPPRPDLLELGCGAGVESTRILAERGRLTGVDISEAQLDLARQRVPSATFVRADLAKLEFAAQSFDGVVALYVLFHLPRIELGPLLGRIRDWLRPCGVFLATMLARGKARASRTDLGCRCSSAARTPTPVESRSATQASKSFWMRPWSRPSPRAICLSTGCSPRSRTVPRSALKSGVQARRWAPPRPECLNELVTDDDRHLLAAIELAQQARDNGNHPFGALLVDADDKVVVESENTVVTGRDCTGHAETNVMRVASERFDPDFLQSCTLYTSTEPCAMCAGAIFWGNVRRVVFALSEEALRGIAGHNPANATLAIPCREIFGRGDHKVEVSGPHLEEQARAVHEDFWT